MLNKLKTGRQPAAPKHERDVVKYLAKRVKQLGGEARKVRWEGRNSAPDWVVMLPAIEHPEVIDLDEPGRTIWIEVKAPGLAATFPKNAHERAQHREHERMRAMGQRVVVVDSYEAVDEVLS